MIKMEDQILFFKNGGGKCCPQSLYISDLHIKNFVKHLASICQVFPLTA